MRVGKLVQVNSDSFMMSLNPFKFLGCGFKYLFFSPRNLGKKNNTLFDAIFQIS